MYEIREIRDKAEYDPLLISKQAPFTQAWFYGEWQEMAGRKARRFEIKKNSEIAGFFQVIKYPLFAGKNILYIPHGPVLQNADNNFIKEFHKKLIEISKEENAVLARFDSYPALENLNKYFRKVSDYAYASAYFQPKREWILDIGKTESDLLNGMHPKSRYNIRLAEGKGVKIEIIESDFEKYFEDFYRLMEKTAERNDFKLHPETYYRNILKNCEENKNAFLVLAKYGNEVLAVNVILLFGETAYFVFGGSSDEHKNLMASHLSHWRGILEAKTRGCGIYNFGAVSSGGDEKFEGISIFKKRFGGRNLEYSDSYDLVFQPVWHFLYDLKKKYRL